MAPPSASAATARSSSVVALAIQVTSCSSTRLRSAVTRPPPPRLATRRPSASCSYVTGPRLETMMSFRRPPTGRHPTPGEFDGRSGCAGGNRHELGLAGVVPRQAVEERQPVPQEARREEVLADVLLAAPAAPPRLLRRLEDLTAGRRALLDRVDEPPGLTVLDLRRDPADTAGDGRPRLPESLRHGQAEPLANRLLQHCRRVDLERVDLDGADVVEVREDEDVGVACGVLDGLVVVLPAFGVVVRHRADERELDARMHVPHASEGVDHAERVLPRIEPGDLREERPVDVDPELVDDVGGVLGRECHVLRRQWIDRRRPDERLGQVIRPWHVLRHVEDRRVVPGDQRQQELEDVLVRRREIDVAAPDPLSRGVGGVVDHRHRLGVVDDHEVVVRVVEVGGVRAVVFVEDLLLLLGQPLRIPLQRVVDRLRDVEELVLSLDDQPVRLEPGALHERDERVVDLGDAAPESGGRDVGDALPGKRATESLDVGHQPATADRRVIDERLRTDVDVREHRLGVSARPEPGLQCVSASAWMNFTNRSRDPCPRSPGPTSSSSASSRMIAMPRPPSESIASPADWRSRTVKPSPSSDTSTTRRSGWSSYTTSTDPSRPSRYAWRTEFEHASVTASLRSPNVSSESWRDCDRPLRARRTSVMYSAFAGIVKRTVGAPPFVVAAVMEGLDMVSGGFSSFTGKRTA